MAYTSFRRNCYPFDIKIKERITTSMNVKEATVKRIEMLCKESGITYNELANLCGVTPSTIYSVLDPKRKNITLSTVKKICVGFEITLAEFFSTPFLMS